ncbi:hypothetical protein D3C73_1127950 [compost metagenome]
MVTVAFGRGLGQQIDIASGLQTHIIFRRQASRVGVNILTRDQDQVIARRNSGAIQSGKVRFTAPVAAVLKRAGRIQVEIVTRSQHRTTASVHAACRQVEIIPGIDAKVPSCADAASLPAL